MDSTTQIQSSNGGLPSPEMHFVGKFHEPTCSQKEEQIPQEAFASDQSQSLLQGWINSPSATENVSKPDFSLNAAVEEQQNNSLDTELNGVQKDSEEKPVGEQQREKEVISDYCGATSGEEQTNERGSPLVEAAACAETTQTISGNAMELRDTPSKCSLVSSHQQILEDTQQAVSHSDEDKNFKKIQKSKDNKDPETNICQEITQNEDREENTERRRSKRIENKLKQEAFVRNFVNLAFPISLSTINRRNMFGETILHRAVAQQNIDFVRNIIKSGGNVNVQDYAGWTALHTASAEGFYEIANELLKSGADVNAVGQEQITPLQDAVKEGHYEIAELLLWYGADPLLKDESGRCALEEASDPSMRKLLTSYVARCERYSVSGGDDSDNMLNTQSVMETNLHQTDESELPRANLTDSSSMDILHQTVVNEVQDIITTTVSENGTSCTEQTLQANAETLLAHEVLAATSGEGVSGSPCNSTSAVLSTTKEKVPQPEEGGRILLNAEERIEECHNAEERIEECHNAEERIEECHMEIECITSLELETEPVVLQLHENDTSQIGQEREDLQETILKSDLHFGVNADSNSPYSFQIVENVQKETSQKTDEEVLAGVSGTECTDKNGEGNAETSVLSKLTETEVQTERAGLDFQKTSEPAASYSSSSKNNLACNQPQFSQTSEQQTSKKSGSFPSAIEEAVIFDHTYHTRYRTMIQRKRNAQGETQLHIAARRGDLPLVKDLLSVGICVNAQDNTGWTAMHEACRGGFTEVISELLKAGADVNHRGLDGILPIHDAVSGNYLEAVKILLQHGANPCEKNGSGISALDQAGDDEMKELLKSYSSTDSALPVESTEITERRYSLRSRTSKRHYCNFYINDDAALESQHEKHSVPAATIQNAEKIQKELLLFELRTSKDADLYIQRLSQAQETLNKMLAKQKTERDTLAKKYRASMESFKNGALRKQLVNLAARQKTLLAVAQKQEELVQKIQNYKKTKEVFRASCLEKQISISHGNDERQSLTAGATTCPDVAMFNTGLDASMLNGNCLEAHLSSENQECSQDPHISFDETGANQDAIRCKEASDHALASKNRIREDPVNMSKMTNAVESVTLPSEPAVSTVKTRRSQQKCIDCVGCVAAAEKGKRSVNPSSVTKMLNTVEARSSLVSVCQPGNYHQQVPTDEELHRYMNKGAAAVINSNKQQQLQVISLTPTKNFSNTLQQTIFWSNDDSFNANSALTSLTSNTDYAVNLSEKSSQSYRNQGCEQNLVRCGRRHKKKLQLIDLLDLGRIKPGENVLEFKLQEFSHKATLLSNGKIRTSESQILQNPVQWVKELLGNNIYVSWQYAWNKVTYLGRQLSKFVVEEAAVSSDLELSSQEGESLGRNFITRSSNYNQHHQSPGSTSITQPSGNFLLSNMQPQNTSLPQRESVKTLLHTDVEAAITRELKRSSVLFNSVESLTHFLQFHEIVVVGKEEFLPCPVMEKHWNFYKECEDFGF